MSTQKSSVVSSVQELRLLAGLTCECKSPRELAEVTKIPRPSVYVLLRRLAERKLVKVKPAPTKSTPTAVVYCITPKGLRARENYAKMVGLQT